MDIEKKIKSLKDKREKLVGLRAEKVATLKAAQEDIKALREEALAKGFDLNDLAGVVEAKKQELQDKIQEMEDLLNAAEESLRQYENL
jgi:uncharacterized protein (UPF0335 family)